MKSLKSKSKEDNSVVYLTLCSVLSAGMVAVRGIVNDVL